MNNIGILRIENQPYVPKKELLLFDKIAVPSLEYWIQYWKGNEEYQNYAGDLEFLAQRGLIYELEVKDNHKEYFEEIIKSGGQCEQIPSWAEGVLLEYLKLITYPYEYIQHYAMDYAAYGKSITAQAQAMDIAYENNGGIEKLYSLYADTVHKDNSVPIVGDLTFSESQNMDMENSKVIDVVLSSISLPNEQTPLEQIIDFRNDKEARHKLLGLRKWMRSIGEKEMSSAVISEELEYAVFEYEKYMSIQNLRFQSGCLESIVVGTASVLENIVKIKWSKVAQEFFKIGKNRVTLIESEMNAPGKELAYVSSINKQFNY